MTGHIFWELPDGMLLLNDMHIIYFLSLLVPHLLYRSLTCKVTVATVSFAFNSLSVNTTGGVSTKPTIALGLRSNSSNVGGGDECPGEETKH